MSESLSAGAVSGTVDRLAAEVVAEITDRLHAGEPVDVEEYIARHPELADRLRPLLAALDLLARFSSSAGSDGRPGGAGAGEEMCGTLGDFRLIREVGRGGMGIVYEAEQISLGRRVALKVLPFAATMDSRQLQRFHNEARAAAGLHHTNIVPVYAVGSERGVHYYAMQFIEGKTLAALIADVRQRRGRPAVPEAQPTTPHVPGAPAPTAPAADTAGRAAASTERAPLKPAFFRRVARLALQAAEALDHAHSLGIVHRDVKPANLLVDGDGRLWVTDFGLAQVQSDVRLTQTGDLVGTLRYMSPEQALAKRVVIDHRTDVYSLGATLYEMLTLEPAVKGADRQEVLRQIAFEEPRLPRRLNRGIPADLETIVLKAMEKNPAERYATAQEVADDLRRFLGNEPIRAKPPTLRQWAGKWARRHRALVFAAGITVGVIVIVLAISTVVTAAALKRESDQKRIAEDQQHIAEEAQGNEAKLRTQAERARDGARWNAYLFSIPLAQSHWEAGEVEQAERLLDSQRPGPGEQDLRGWEWYHLLARCHDDLLTLHEDPPEKALEFWSAGPYVAWSPDGSRLAWFGLDQTVRIWDVPTKQRRLTLRDHGGRVWSAAWSPDGKRLATGGDDRTVKVWDASTGQELAALPGHARQVTSVAWSPDGKRLASASFFDRTAKIWDVDTGKEVRSWSNSSAPFPQAVTWSPDGTQLAVSCDSNSAVIRAVREESEPVLVGTPPGAAGPVSQSPVAWSPDGHLLALLTLTEVQVWDPVARQKVRAIPGVWGAMAWKPGSNLLATVVGGRVIKAWDAKTGKEAFTLRGHTARITSLAWAADGRLASASEDLAIKVWDTGSRDGFLLGERTDLGRGAELSPDGSRLVDFVRRRARGNSPLTVDLKVWDLAQRKVLLTIPGLQLPAVSWSRDGQRLAYVERGRVAIWDVSAGRLSPIDLPPQHEGSVWRPFWSPDGKQLAIVSDVSVKVWDLATSKEIPFPRVPDKPRMVNVSHQWMCAAWSPDGRWFACSGNPGVIRLWDTQTGQEALPLPGHAQATHQLTWSPDGKQLLSNGFGVHDRDGKIWDVEARKQVFHVQGAHLGPWSPDGQRYSSRDLQEPFQVRLWDAGTYQEVCTLPGTHPPLGWGAGLLWSPDSRRLTELTWDSVAQDVRVRFWDAGRGYELAEQGWGPSFASADSEDRVFTLLQFGDSLQEMHRPAAAEQAYRDALATAEKLVGVSPNVPGYRQLLGRSHYKLGTLFRSTGRTPDAEEAFGLALNVQTPLKEQVGGGQEDLARTHDELGSLLEQVGRPREAARHYAEVGRYPGYSRVERLNNVAWFLATCPDPGARDSAVAVEVAEKLWKRIAGNVAASAQFRGEVSNTLGVAYYRNGDAKAAVEALNRSVDLRKGGDSFDFFFLAMAHWQLGEKDKGKEWYDKAVAWMGKNKPQDEELRRFRAEAAELLGGEQKKD